MEEVKYCSRCKCRRNIELFEANRKICMKCQAKNKIYYQQKNKSSVEELKYDSKSDSTSDEPIRTDSTPSEEDIENNEKGSTSNYSTWLLGIGGLALFLLTKGKTNNIDHIIF